jgi:hypothetical protein
VQLGRRSSLGDEDGKPSFEVVLKERREGAEAQRVFELSTKSFDDGNGAGFADRAEPMPDSKVEEKKPKSGIRELRPFVGNKMPREPETPHGFENKDSDVLGGGLFVEGTEREGHPRKHIRENTSKITASLKRKRPKRPGTSVKSAIHM